MSDPRLRLIASSGLVVGAILGMAGSFAPSASLRGLAWGLDGVALVVAGALLTVVGRLACPHQRDQAHATVGPGCRLHRGSPVYGGRGAALLRARTDTAFQAPTLLCISIPGRHADWLGVDALPRCNLTTRRI